MTKTRRIILLFVFIFIIAIFVTSISSSFASFTTQSTEQYEQEFELNDITFTVNGKKVNTITNRDQGLIARGNESTLDFQIKVESRLFWNYEAYYSFDVSVFNYTDYTTNYPDAPTLSDSSYYTGALAYAIDVYEYINGEYIYLSNLKEFTHFDGYVKLSQTSVHEYLVNRSFKLVYSQAAGDYYENTGFILNLKANSELIDYEISKRYYVNSAYELAEIIMNEDSYNLEGKTIVLASNIELTDEYGVDEYKISSKVGIDLNGYQLKIADNVGLTIDWSADAYDANLLDIGLFDSAPESMRQAESLVGTITIVPNTDDFYLIQDDIYIQSKAVIKVNSCNLTRFVEAFNKNINYYEKLLLTKGSTTAPQYIKAFKNISYYVRNVTIDSSNSTSTIVSAAINSSSSINYAKAFFDVDIKSNLDSNVLAFDSNAKPILLMVDTNYDESLTEVITFSTIFTDRSTNPDTDRTSNTLTLRGEDPYTIATSLLALIPNSFNPSDPSGLSGDYINSSLFLPAFDESSKATITWESSDHTYFNPNGTYLNNNYDGSLVNPIVFDDLDDWGSKILRIGVIVSTPDGEESYAEKLVVVSPVDAKQRTELLYNYKQFELAKAGDMLFIPEDFFNTGDKPIIYRDKASYIGLGIKLYGLKNVDVDNNFITFLQLITAIPDINDPLGYSINYVTVENDLITLTNHTTQATTSLTSTTKTTISTTITEYSVEYDSVYYRLVVENLNDADVGNYQDIYLEVIPTDPSKRDLTVDVFYRNQLQLDAFVFIPTEFTFIYDDSFENPYTYGDTKIYGGRIEHTLKQDITVMGMYKALELHDPRPFLQYDFSNNVYIEGDSFTFYAKAYTLRGSLVHYIVESSQAALLLVENNIFRQLSKNYDDINNYPAHSEGRFYKNTNGYTFFMRYDYMDNLQKLYLDDGMFFEIDGVEYTFDTELANGNIYTHSAKFQVQAEVLPPVKQTIINIEARFYEGIDSTGKPLLDAQGNIKWLYQTTDVLPELVKYNLTLIVFGIYHNNPQEIADVALYNELKKWYDKNKNGYIEITEAELPWSEIESTTMQYLNNTTYHLYYYYIDAAGKNISSLKGLEYFINLKNITLATNSIENLSPLTYLSSLTFISLVSNNISDLEGLRFLDNLEYLNLQDNKIVDLKPIQHLLSVKWLRIAGNTNIVDFLPISGYKNLLYYDARCGDALMANSQSIYAISLTQYNSPTADVIIYSNVQIQPRDNAKIVAARALSNLIVANLTQTTLNVPNTYQWLDANNNLKTYTIRWSVVNLDDQKYINFVEDANKNTIGYVIKNTIVNRDITIQVQVTEDGSSTGAIFMARRVNILLLAASDAQEVWMQMTPAESSALITYYNEVLHKTPPVAARTVSNAAGTWVYYVAADIIVDPALLDTVINLLNTDATTSLPGDINDMYVLSIAERGTSITSTELQNHGITSIEGLQFCTGLTTRINLTGNVLDDLIPISKMSNLVWLTISGKKYDYTQITDNYASPAAASTFTTLDVVSCYGTSENDSLSKLYQLYLLYPKLNIYKDSSSVVWNPYEKIVLQNQLFDPTFVISQKGQKYYVFGNESDLFKAVRLYDVQSVNYFITSITINYRETNMVDSTYFQVLSKSGTVSAIAQNLTGPQIQTKAITSRSVSVQNGIECLYSPFESATLIVSIQFKFYDGRTDSSSHEPPLLTVHLKTEPSDHILVVDYKPTSALAAREVPIAVVYPGLSLRSVVMKKLEAIFTSTTTKTGKAATTIGTGYYYETSTKKYYITQSTLGVISFSATDIQEISGEGYSQIVYNSITYSNLLPINGLALLKNLKGVTFIRDARLGDGSELVNLVTINIRMSVADFSTLDYSKPLTNLKNLRLGNDASNGGYNSVSSLFAVRGVVWLNANAQSYLSTAFLPNLEVLHLLQCGLKEWSILQGFANSVSNKIAQLYTYSSATTSNNYNNNLYYKNKNNNSPTAALYVEQIYKNSSAQTKDYRIGEPSQTNDTKEENSNYIYTPDAFKIEVTAMNMLDISVDAEFSEFSTYITGLDVRFDNAPDNYSISSAAVGFMSELPDGSVEGTYRDTALKEMNKDNKTIYLPASTFNASFGTYYGSIQTTIYDTSPGASFERAFSISWFIHGVSAASAAKIFKSTSNSITFVDYNTDTSMNTVNDWGGKFCRIDFNDYKSETLELVTDLASDVFIIIEGIIGVRTGYTNPSKVGYFDVIHVGQGSDPTKFKFDPTTATLTPFAFSAAMQSFVYPLFIRNPKVALDVVTSPASTYLSYGVFDDMALRTLTYLVMCKLSGHMADTFTDSNKTYPGGYIIASVAASVKRINASNESNASTANNQAAPVVGQVVGYSTTSVTASANTNVSFQYSTVVLLKSTSQTGGNDRLAPYVLNLYSLVGLDKVYTGLTEFSANNNNIQSLKGIEGLKNSLQWLYLDGNMLQNLDELKDFNKLLVVNVARNRLTSIKHPDGDYSSFYSATTTLASINLSYNYYLDLVQLQYLEKTLLKGNTTKTSYILSSTSSSTAITTTVRASLNFELYVYDTAAQRTYSEAFWNSIYKIFSNLSSFLWTSTITSSSFFLHATYIDDKASSANGLVKINPAQMNHFFNDVIKGEFTDIKDIKEKGLSANGVSGDTQDYLAYRQKVSSNATYGVNVLYFPLQRLAYTTSASAYVGMRSDISDSGDSVNLSISSTTSSFSAVNNLISYAKPDEVIILVSRVAVTTYLSSQLQVRYTVPFKHNSALSGTVAFRTNSSHTLANNPNQVIVASDVDPAIWFYLCSIGTPTLNTTDGIQYITDNTVSRQIIIYSDCGIKSLKGLHKMQNVYEIYIYAPSLDSLFEDYWPPKLRILTITGSSALLSEQDIARSLSKVDISNLGLAFSLNFYTLQLNYNKGIGQIVKFDGKDYTTLGGLISAVINKIQTGSYICTYLEFSFDVRGNLDNFYNATKLVKTNNMMDKTISYFYNIEDSLFGNKINVSTVSSTSLQPNYRVMALSSFVGMGKNATHNAMISTTSTTGNYVTTFNVYLTDYISLDVITDLSFFNHDATKYLYWQNTSSAGLYNVAILNSGSQLRTNATLRSAVRNAYLNLEKASEAVLNMGSNSSPARGSAYLIPATITVKYDSANPTEYIYYMPSFVFYYNIPIQINYNIESTPIDLDDKVKVVTNTGNWTSLLKLDSANLSLVTVTTKYTLTTPSFTGAYSTYVQGTPASITSTYKAQSVFTINPASFEYVNGGGTTTLKKHKLYLEIRDSGTDKTGSALVPAEDYFESPLLISSIINGCLSSSIIYTDVTNSVGFTSGTLLPALISTKFTSFTGDQSAYFLSYTQITNAKTLKIVNTGPIVQLSNVTTGHNNSITSIKGVELFTNLKTLAISHSSILDLSPIKNLALENFYFSSNVGYVSTISTLAAGIKPRFTLKLLPLLGSASSLLRFSIQDVKSSDDVDYTLDYEDLNILKAFTKLTNVYIGAQAYSKLNIIETANYLQFYTLYTWFVVNRSSVNFSIPAIGNMESSFVSTESREAVEFFSKITPTHFTDSGATGTNFLYDFLFKPIKDQNTVTNGIIETKLPAYIDSGGVYTALRWFPASSVITNDGYKFASTNTGTTYYFVNNTIALKHGDSISYDNLQKLLKDSSFINLMYAKTISCYTSIKTDSKHSLFQYLNTTIYCRATINSIDHIAYYTYDFSEFL
ncbi:MAG: hypothetical protein LBF12_06290 [Christensenellaceae bacterium]|jgi:hypothetical protein|nr:hypothetical protein [Christensenellaceae bacterium]